MLILLGIKQINLNDDAQENVNFRNRLLGFLLGCSLAWLRINLHLGFVRTTKRQVLLSDSNEQGLGNVSRVGCSRESFGNSTTNDVGAQVFTDKRNRSQGAEGESSIEERNSAVEEGKVALYIC